MADENPFSEREASTLESKRGAAAAEMGGRVEPDRLRELEQSVARCEAQIRALTQRVQEQDMRAAAAKQRAVWLRLGLLFILLAGYVYLRSRVS
jgi:hypothetical protein